MERILESTVSEEVLNSFPGIAFLLSAEGQILRWNKNLNFYVTKREEGFNPNLILTVKSIESNPPLLDVMKDSFEKEWESFQIDFFNEYGQNVPFFLTCKSGLYENQKCLLGYALELTGKFKIQEELNLTNHFLNERIKELNTLHATNALLHLNHLSIEEVLSKFVYLLPDGWQYPEITTARLIFHNKVYQTENYRETPWMMSSEVELHDKRVLNVEISYLEEKPALFEGPFLKEERELLNSLIEMVASYLEKKNESEVVQKLEANLNSIFQSTDTSYILIDKNFKIVMFNKIAADRTYFVFKKQLEVGKSMLDIVNLERREISASNYRRVLDGESLQYEVSYVIDNTPFYFLTMLTPIKSETNKINGICFTSLDFTVRKNFENQKELFVSIVNSSQDAIFSNDLNGIITSWNKSAENIFGYSETEAVGKHNSLLMSKYNPELDKMDIQLDKEFQILQNHETKMFSKDGRVIDVSLSVSPIKNFLGDILGTSMIVRDITQKKLVEETLVKSEANLKTILNVTKIAYVLLDTDFKIKSHNSRSTVFVKEEFGHEICIGEFFHEYFNENKNSMFGHLQRAILGDEISFEVNYKLSDESTNWYFFIIYPIRNNFQQSIGVLISIENITEFKREEMQRRKLTNDILQRNKDLEQFAYIVSHNLRAPVANILGLANVLDDASVEEDIKKNFIKELSKSAFNLDSVIRDLNSILQLKREVFENKELINFQKLSMEIWNGLTSLVKEETITLQTDFSEMEEIKTIRSNLHSIFYNLITNSIKYRRPGHPTLIQITSKKNHEGLILSFKDNGLGIDLEKKKDQVFGMYKRFHLNTAEGKGMGLFITKSQVEAIGGNISIKSNVNVGTEFIIELPIQNESF